MLNLLARLWEHKDCKGAHLDLGVGAYRAENLGSFEYKTSALEVPLGLNVTLFGHWACDPKDKLHDYHPGKWDYVGDDFNDRTRSVVVLPKSIFYVADNGGFNWINETHPIPAGYDLFCDEETCNKGSWGVWIENGSTLRIHVDHGGGWCGVAVTLKENGGQPSKLLFGSQDHRTQK